jgi:glycosyltransferase involved in cell wall biosynthesis
MSKSIVHVTQNFFPFRGWSESIIWPLIEINQKNNYSITVIIDSETEEDYLFNSIQVKKISFKKFTSVLNEIKPSKLIFHYIPGSVDFTTEFITMDSIFLLHHFNSICQRGDFIKYGKKVCDSTINTSDCGKCYIHSLGIPQPFNSLVFNISPHLKNIHRSGKIKTLFNLRNNVKKSILNKIAFLKQQSRIITLNQWTLEEIVKLGIEPAGIKYSPLPITQKKEYRDVDESVLKTDELNLVFIGRVATSKGLEIMFKVMNSLKKKHGFINLDIYGPIEDPVNFDKLFSTYAGVKIKYFGLLDDTKVIQTMSRYNFVLVPSQTVEIGPLVVMEAFRAGKKVIASNLHGISELISTPDLGYLVEFNKPNKWVKAILTAAEERNYTLNFNFENREINLLYQNIFND